VSRGSSQGQGGSAAHKALAQQVGGRCAQHRGRIYSNFGRRESEGGGSSIGALVSAECQFVEEDGRDEFIRGMSELARREQSYDGSLLPRAWIGANLSHVTDSFSLLPVLHELMKSS
jgi:hypothetical protein